MLETEVCTCRVHGGPDGPSETIARWAGRGEPLDAVGIPAGLTPGNPVTVPAIELSAGVSPIRVEIAGRTDLDVAWSDATPAGSGVVLWPEPDMPTTWDATFDFTDSSIDRPRELHLRLGVARMALGRSARAASLALSALLGLASLSALVSSIQNDATALFILAIAAAVGAFLASPTVVGRAAVRHRKAFLLSPREPSVLTLPEIVANPATSLSDAVADPAIRDFCTRLAESLSQLSILGLASPISLDEGYVPVTLRIRRKSGVPMTVPLEAYTEVDQLIDSDLRLRSLLGDETLSPEEAWRQHSRLTIVGDVGTGKTTVLHRLACILARGPVLWSNSVPVFLELHQLARRPDLAGNPLESLRDAVCEAIAGEGTDEEHLAHVGELVDRLIEDGELTLLFDGLDEVSAPAGEEHRLLDALLAAISRAALRWPNVRMVVTCRKASMDRYRRLPDTFVAAETVPFDDASIRSFVRHYFAANPEQATRLLDEIQRNPRIRGLTTTPLLLALMTLIFEQRGSLPQRKAETYRRCAALLLREWDEGRGIERNSQFPAEHKEEFLRRLAWDLHSAGSRYIQHADLLSMLNDFLPSVGLSPSRALDLLVEITSVHGLVRGYDDNWYGFVHFALQEYFTSECIERRCPVAEAIADRHRAWWQEVIRLYAGRGDCSNLIRALLREPEDLFHTNLRLAGECAAEGSAIQPDLYQRLLTQIRDTVRTLRIPQVDAKFWQVLVQASGPEAAEFAWGGVADGMVSIEARLAILEQMRQWPWESIADEAVRRLTDEQLATEIRVAIADLIATSGGPGVRDQLFDAATNGRSEPSVRAAAVAALGRLGDKEAVGPLAELVFREDLPTEVRIQVASSLRLLGATGLGDRMLALVNDWHVEASVRASMASVVGDLAGERHVQGMVRALDESKLPSAVATALAMSLRAVHSASLANDLMSLVEAPQVDYGVRLAIADALGAVARAEHRDALRALSVARSSDEPIRQRLAIASGAVGDPDAIPSLVVLLRDDTVRPHLRLEAARILGTSPDEELGSAMLDILGTEEMDSLGQELAALVLTARSDPSLGAELVGRLSDKRVPLPARLQIARSLARLGSGEVVDRMISLLPDRTYTRELRSTVAIALTRFTDARDQIAFERVARLLPEATDVPETTTLAWHLSVQIGLPIMPADVGGTEITYDWVGDEDELSGSVETSASGLHGQTPPPGVS